MRFDRPVSLLGGRAMQFSRSKRRSGLRGWPRTQGEFEARLCFNRSRRSHLDWLARRATRFVIELHTALENLYDNGAAPAFAQIAINITFSLWRFVGQFVAQLITAHRVATVGKAGQQVLHAAVALAFGVD